MKCAKALTYKARTIENYKERKIMCKEYLELVSKLSEALEDLKKITDEPVKGDVITLTIKASFRNFTKEGEIMNG